MLKASFALCLDMKHTSLATLRESESRTKLATSSVFEACSRDSDLLWLSQGSDQEYPEIPKSDLGRPRSAGSARPCWETST